MNSRLEALPSVIGSIGSPITILHEFVLEATAIEGGTRLNITSLRSGEVQTVDIMNGYTPEKGVDYMTNAEKEEMVQEATDAVLAATKADTSLSIAGKPADAAAVGNALNEIEDSIQDLSAEIPEPYVLPPASMSSLGGVRVGSGFNISSSGVISLGLSDMVRYNATQALSNTQKTKARRNIDAVGTSDYMFDHSLIQHNLMGHFVSGTLNGFSEPTSGEIRHIVNSNITYVGSGSFSALSNLESVDLPNCTYIDSGGFSGCTSLKSVHFPKVEFIGGGAFGGCIFESLVLPNVKTLFDGALYNPNNLAYVDIYCVVDIGNGSLSSAGLKTLILRNDAGLSTIEEYAFNSAADFHIYVPEALKSQYEAAAQGYTYAARFRAIEDYPDVVPPMDDGSIECPGVVLTSPNGTRYKLTVNDGGAVTTTEM